LHVHLREPGREDEETVLSGTKAAAAGGFTAVACMANTFPVNDNRAVTDYILARAKVEGVVRVYPIGAVTRNLEGKQLAEMAEQAEAGAAGELEAGEVRRLLHEEARLDLRRLAHAAPHALVGEARAEGGAHGVEGEVAVADEAQQAVAGEVGVAEGHQVEVAAQSSADGRARRRFTPPRERFATSRRSRAAALGFVAVRDRGRTRAAATSARTFSRASSRLRA